MIGKLCRLITGYFPLWVVLGSITFFLYPDLIKSQGKYVSYYNSIILLSMGLNMKVDDFKLVLSRPKDVLWGVIPRYCIMPLVAFSIAKMMGLPPALAAGLILVGSCPSALASNVMTFLSKGDIALSVTVSSVNTVLAPFLTPMIFLFLAGSMVAVNADALLLDIVKMVMLPIALGVGLRMFASKYVEKALPYLPVISTTSLLMIVFAGTALNADRLASVAAVAFAAVALHNGLGLLLGYITARKVAKMDMRRAKAITFEIGMENNALAIALALAHLDPLAAIPATIFNVWHNLTGSALATYWSKQADAEENDATISEGKIVNGS